MRAVAVAQTFKRWNQIDPPDAEEKARNDQIEAMQGNRNRYNDAPAVAEQLTQE